MGSGSSSPGANSQEKVYGHGCAVTWPFRTGVLRTVRKHILRECAAQRVALGPGPLPVCRNVPVHPLQPCSMARDGLLVPPQVKDLWLSRGRAGAHRCPLCSCSRSTILIPRKGWHMLLNLCFHIAMTAAVFAGGITLTGYRAVCQAVGTGQCPALQGPAGRVPGGCGIPAPTAASSRRSASSCTTRPSPRCSGWR